MLEKILSTVPENVLGPEMPFWLPAKHIPLSCNSIGWPCAKSLICLFYFVGNFYLLLPAIWKCTKLRNNILHNTLEGIWFEGTIRSKNCLKAGKKILSFWEKVFLNYLIIEKKFCYFSLMLRVFFCSQFYQLLMFWQKYKMLRFLKLATCSST